MKEVGYRPEIHIFVCTNDRANDPELKNSCGPEITHDTVKRVKKWILDSGFKGRVQCTRTGCLGMCPEDGGTAMIYPSNKTFIGVHGAEDIIDLLKTELKK
ncbi:MAG: (2Fe-2S) ferredoxin domain-containing protein [Nanoarchaeota archaeon]